ncbi:methyltransferase family protein [Sneathiella chungangensis]|uniref:methyltransferase family protein n=2 Tax=Sneathiella chungangensis TaxID=1418234 RepID=UPI001472E6A9
MIQRYSILIYALVAYAIASFNLVYIMGFLAELYVPKNISDGIQGELWTAILIDIGLLWLFGLHHSITARTWFKKYWTRFVPRPIERATYLYMTAIMTGLLIHFWRPIPITVWQFDTEILRNSIYGVYLLIWGLMLLATFQFGYFGFFGLKQAWERFRNKHAAATGFSAKWLYGIVRHPISLCWMMMPWITPHLTVGHIVFALGISSYILVATPFEEMDLIGELGDKYRQYRKNVPAFFPFARKRQTTTPTEPAE